MSTKSMVGSYGKNLANRFEEAYGDAKNLRGRFPLASMGFLFLMHSTVLDAGGSFERAKDMLRKLRAESDVYDATSLVLAEWSDAQPSGGVRLLSEEIPEDLEAGSFLAGLVDCVLDRTPLDAHVEVRQRREHRQLSLEESDTEI